MDDSTRLQELIEPLEQPARWKEERVRALHPFQADDGLLLEAVNRGSCSMASQPNRHNSGARDPRR